MSTHTLTDQEVWTTAANVTKQRDELLAALREIATADYTRIDVATLGNIARAAITKATEVQS